MSFFIFKSIIREKGFEKKNVTKMLRDVMRFILKKKIYFTHEKEREGKRGNLFMFCFVNN